MMQIAICDRSVAHAARLKTLLGQIESISASSIEHYQNPGSFLQALEVLCVPDLVFLDVTLNLEGALRIAKTLNSRFPATQIVLMSCYVSHATDISDVDHCYFLIKPFDPTRVRAAVEKAQATIDATQEQRLLLPIRGGAEVILLMSQIIYFERMRRTTIVNCADGKIETALKLTELEEKLPTQRFARPHNSYLVNLDYVKKIERFCLHLINGEVLPISNQRRLSFRETLECYLK